MPWITACGVEDIDPEDALRFDHAGQTHAIYRAQKGAFFATDGLCSQNRVHLCDRLVMGDQIESPKRNGRFNYRTDAALLAPVCINLKPCPTRITGDAAEIEVN